MRSFVDQYFSTLKKPTILALLIMILTVLTIVILLPKGLRFKYEFEKGKVWMHKDLVSPFDYSIQKTEEQLQQDYADALSSLTPVYRLDYSIGEFQLENFKKTFDLKWNLKYTNNVKRSANFQVGMQLLEEVYNVGLLALNEKYQKNNSYDYVITVAKNNVAEERNTSSLFTIDKASYYLKKKMTRYSDIDTSLLFSLMEEHLVPNIIFDEALTTRMENDAINNISLTRGMVQKNELIIARGNIIDPKAFQKLESLRNQYDQRLGAMGNKYLISLGQLLLVGLVITLLMVFLALFRKDIFSDIRQLSLLLLVVTIMLAVLSWAITTRLPSIYLIPYCIVPIIIRILFDTRLALYIHILVVIIAGFFAPNGFEFVFLQVTAGMVAIYSIKNLLRRAQFLISALLIFITYVTAYIGISLIQEGGFSALQPESFLWFGTSVVLSLLAYPLIYVFERLFGVSSDLSLIELTNSNHPLLRELSLKAPGTFQHSLQVANLAEEAIYKIGGNALLIRAGALYHDIGKMDTPQYFIENQNKSNNPHDELTFEQSARIIIKHVHRGVELANEHRLPDAVIDFIRTHHGTTRVDYFYHSFLKNFPGRLVNENIFRYPGPIPFSREMAVMMLADSVEAASRSLKEPNHQSIEELVDRIIDYKLDEKQLRNSDITLKEIDMIRGIFKDMLKSIYHLRVEYPLEG